MWKNQMLRLRVKVRELEVWKILRCLRKLINVHICLVLVKLFFALLLNSIFIFFTELIIQRIVGRLIKIQRLILNPVLLLLLIVLGSYWLLHLTRKFMWLMGVLENAKWHLFLSLNRIASLLKLIHSQNLGCLRFKSKLGILLWLLLWIKLLLHIYYALLRL